MAKQPGTLRFKESQMKAYSPEKETRGEKKTVKQRDRGILIEADSDWW